MTSVRKLKVVGGGGIDPRVRISGRSVERRSDNRRSTVLRRDIGTFKMLLLKVNIPFYPKKNVFKSFCHTYF